MSDRFIGLQALRNMNITKTHLIEELHNAHLVFVGEQILILEEFSENRAMQNFRLRSRRFAVTKDEVELNLVEELNSLLGMLLK